MPTKSPPREGRLRNADCRHKPPWHGVVNSPLCGRGLPRRHANHLRALFRFRNGSQAADGVSTTSSMSGAIDTVDMACSPSIKALTFPFRSGPITRPVRPWA